MEHEQISKLEQLSSKLWMNGRLVVECRRGKICLRLRYYPVWMALGLYGLMAGLSHFILQRSSDSDFNSLVVFNAVLLPTVFVAIAIYLENKPALLIHDLATNELSVPREGLHLFPAPKKPLGVGDIYFRIGSKRIHGQALYVTSSNAGNANPVFVDHFPKRLATCIIDFAKQSGLQTFQAPTLTL
jgi:hypothetical protein